MSLIAIMLVMALPAVFPYALAVFRRARRMRERQVSSPDYLYIRELERELGMTPTPFPEWLPKVRVPDAIARDWNLSDPVVSWAEAAEIYERGVSSPASPQSR